MDKLKTLFSSKFAYYELAFFLKDYIHANTVIVCIGTDRCIGDCLGPMVGTILKHRNFPLPVFGTISEPIHALNMELKLNEIKQKFKDINIIGIDACLGESSCIGELQARNYPIHPGKGVGKCLPDVGDASIIGIVDSSDDCELFTNRNIRLNLILQMAEVIADSLVHSYYLHIKIG